MAKTHLILAAGHAPQQDPGAVNGHRTEAEEAIAIVDAAALITANLKIPTTIVPHSLGLRESIAWVNARYYSAASIAIEVHKNAAASPIVDGIEVWYEAGNTTEMQFAGELSTRLSNLTGLKNRGIFPDTANRHRRLGWEHLKVDSVLVESGFISCANDLPAKVHGQALGKALAAMFGKLKPKKEDDDMYGRQILSRVTSCLMTAFTGTWRGKKGEAFLTLTTDVNQTAEVAVTTIPKVGDVRKKTYAVKGRRAVDFPVGAEVGGKFTLDIKSLNDVPVTVELEQAWVTPQ